MAPDSRLVQSLGLAACTAIVVGNMVGSGFYLSPAGGGASTGSLAIVFAWIVMGAGAMCLGLTFAPPRAALARDWRRGTPIPGLAYGDFAGFLVALGVLDFDLGVAAGDCGGLHWIARTS